MTIPVIIPSILPLDQLAKLGQEIESTAGWPHKRIFCCSSGSASANRNCGLDCAGDAEMVVMLDDDVMPMNHGWLRILVEALSRPEVVMVSAQLYKPHEGYTHGDSPNNPHIPEPSFGHNLAFAYMTGLQDWGGVPKDTGETIVPTKRLLTACVAFKPSGCRFDEGYIGSGFEDVDYCNQLAAARPDGLFLVCHDSQVVHFNEQREQRGDIWEKNKALYERKWGPVETREQLRRKFNVQ